VPLLYRRASAEAELSRVDAELAKTIIRAGVTVRKIAPASMSELTSGRLGRHLPMRIYLRFYVSLQRRDTRLRRVELANWLAAHRRAIRVIKVTAAG
jgi:hypothetical protein